LFGPNGEMISTAFVGRKEFVLAEAGTYLVKVFDDNLQSGGNYQIELGNIAPTANPDSNSVTEDQPPNPVGGNVLANDTDDGGPQPLLVSKVNGLAASVGAVVSGTYGTVQIGGNGTYSYTLNNSALIVQALRAGQLVQDVFQYTASDGALESSSTLTITITGTNDAPVANPDSYSVAEGGALTRSDGRGTATAGDTSDDGVLANDTDVDNIPTELVSLHLVGSGPQHGTLAFNPDGSFTYVHNGSETTSDSFQYQANDGLADSNIATVSITVTAVNDAPVNTVPGLQTVNEDTTLVFSTANGKAISVSDVDAGSGTVRVTLSATNGAVTLASVAGLNLTIGDGSADPAVEFSGTVAAINTALNGLSFALTVNFNGAAALTIETNDLGNTGSGGPLSDTDTVNITVTAVNDAPVAVNDSFNINEDTQLTVAGPGVLSNDTDVDNDSLTAVLVSNVQHGTLTLNPNGAFSYTPNANYNGPDSFTYKANDGSLDSGVATVNITINAVNDAPVANNDSYSTNEDVELVVGAPGILGNDTDIDSSTLTTILVDGPQHGQLVLNNLDGSFVYTPAANFFGSDSFAYKANDGQVESNTATVTIMVNAVNDASVAVNDSFSTDEDTTLAVSVPGVLGNDTDVENSALTAIIVTSVSHGTLTLNSNGSFTYTPASNFNGSDSFTYNANDGQLDSNVATVSITVNAVNDAPVAVNDSFATNEDTQLVAGAPGVLGNDTDIDSATLTVLLVTAPQQGTLALNADGSFIYTPNANYNGPDSFTYKASDGSLESSIATVTITVNAVNNAPSAANDAFSTSEDTQLVAAAPGVLGNDTDVDSALLTAVLVTTPQHGTLTLNANGSFTYTPAANYFGPDSFTYKANDGLADSNIATVNITVNAVNDAPVALNDSFNTNEDTQLAVAVPGVLGNDTDVDSITLTASLVSGPQHGTLALTGNGSFTYTPNANFNGPDSFTYKANDGQLDSNIATVSITVNAINDAPVAVNDSFSTDEDVQLVIAGAGVLVNDTDVDSATLTAILVNGAQHGQLTLNANGSFTYTPNANYKGPDSFTYNANDGLLDSNVAAVNITVNAVNDAPVAVNDSYSTNEDTPLTVAAPGVVANDADIDSALLTAVLVNDPQHGSVTLNANGSFTYTPAANYFGPDSFTYKANDGQGDSNIATVNITVNAVNDAPVAVNDSYSTDEDVELVVAAATGLLANDTDVDSANLDTILVIGPQRGQLALNNLDGSFIYTPAANFFGSDSFTYKVTDGQAESNVATVSIAVNAVNDPPVAQNESFTTDEDTALVVAAPGVLGNDTDIDSALLTAVLVAAPQHGALTLNGNGSFNYTPVANYFSPDSFTYKANDGQADSNIATVNITINAVNDAPAATNDQFNADEDTLLTVAPPGVLGNDQDVDSDTLTAILISGPQHGTLTFNADGSFSYLPDLDYFGPDSFSYRASDGSLLSNVATAAINVRASNQAPTAVDDEVSTDEDTPVTINVLANDSDADEDPLTIVAVTQPANGAAVINPDGTVTYTPSANFHGTGQFTYTISDGNGETSTAKVTVQVNSINDSPVLADLSGMDVINEGEKVELRGIFSDADINDTFVLTVNWGDGVNQVIDLNDNQSFTLNHRYLDDNPTGTPSDSYQVKIIVTDSGGASSETGRTVVVNNLAPVAQLDGDGSGVRGQALEFAAAFTDPGILDTHQVAWDFGDGTVTGYRPATAEALNVEHVFASTGTYTVKVTVRDDDGGTTTASKQVTIKAIDLQADPCDPTKTALVVSGTNGDDRIRFVPQGNNGEIKVLINGVAQGTFQPTGRIIAYGLNGNDDIEVAGGIGLSAILYGDSGNDRLKAGRGATVLVGGAGEDLLIGGKSRNLLIGGLDADRLIGGSGDDILIGGATQYDHDSKALCEILDDWNRSDLAYSQRIKRSTVSDDGARDQITGGAGFDWYFIDETDKVTDRHPLELIVWDGGQSGSAKG